MNNPPSDSSALSPAPRGSRVGAPAVVLALFALAVALRWWGMEREPFWLDEIMTFNLVDKDIGQVISGTASESHPPLYFLGLWSWRQPFGGGVTALRCYSLVWSLVGLLAVWLLARDALGRTAGLLALLLGALNPHSIYFAQEARMYAQAAALAAFSSWCLWRWMAGGGEERERERVGQVRWAVGYAACAAAALFTHYVCVLLLVSQGLFALSWFAWRRRWRDVWGYLACAAFIATVFLPWLFYVLRGRDSIYDDSRLDWMPTASLSDTVSYLGRDCVWGQAHLLQEPLWIPTLFVLAIIVIPGLIGAASPTATDDATPSGRRKLAIGFALFMLVVPVLLAVTVTWTFRPVFYRPRFASLVLPYFLVLLGLACAGLRQRDVRTLAILLLALAMGAATVVQALTLQKTGMAAFEPPWPKHEHPRRVVFFPHYLDLVARYYSERKIYSAPEETLRQELPELQGARIWVCWAGGHAFESEPGERDYFRWLSGLGRVRLIPPRGSVYSASIDVGAPTAPDSPTRRLTDWFPPLEIGDRLQGFSDSKRFSGLEFDSEQKPYRWSAPEAALRFTGLKGGECMTLGAAFPPPHPQGYQPALRFHVVRAAAPDRLFDSPPVTTFATHRPGAHEFEILAPQGAGPVWLGWRMNGVNLKECGVNNDPRDLGLRVNWVAVSPGAPEVLQDRFVFWREPREALGLCEGFDDPARFYPLENNAGLPFRWSKPQAWLTLQNADRYATLVLNAALPPLVEGYEPALRIYVSRGGGAESLFDGPVAFEKNIHGPEVFEASLAVPPGEGPLLVGWRLNPVNLAAAGVAEDPRDLGLIVHWIGATGEE